MRSPRSPTKPPGGIEDPLDLTLPTLPPTIADPLRRAAVDEPQGALRLTRRARPRQR